MNRRLLIIGAIVVACLLVIGLALTRRGASAPLAVTVVTVRPERFERRLPMTGIVQRPKTQTVAALVGGNLETVDVRAGERVAAGQVLATIVNPQLEANRESAQSALAAARARASGTTIGNEAVPAQNRASVLQARADLQQAQVTLQQARQDLANGTQSGLGYTSGTASEQRLSAQAAFDKAATDLREAKRIFDANTELYANKAISKDQLDQSQARYQTALITEQQARRQQAITDRQLTDQQRVLRDRVRQAENGLARAQAALVSAQAAAKNDKATDVAAAQADAAKAADDLAFAEAQLDRTRLRAPFAGTILSAASQPNDTLRPLQPGDTVTQGQMVFTIAADDRYIVRARVDEQDIAAVAPGQAARISSESFAGKVLPGHVVATNPIAQKSDDPSNTSRQVLATIALDRTLPFLRDGMSVDVDVVTRAIPGALTVPADAVLRDGAATRVLVLTDGVATSRAVTLGEANDAKVVVKSGLAPGDRVIVAKVAPGTRVVPAPSPSTSAAAS